MDEPDVLAQALADPTRRAIIEQLRLGQKTVSELVQITHRKQPNVSNHLAKMRRQGLVRDERVGRQVYYALASPVSEAIVRLHEFTTHSLQVDGQAAAGSKLRPTELAQLADAYFELAMSGQEERVVTQINLMLMQGLSLETIYLDIFQQTLYRVGDLYAQNLTDVAHEHLVSAITERMMARVAQFYSPVTRTPYRAILGCVAENWHTIGVRMLSDGLRSLGWDTRYLGANVPRESFVKITEETYPHLIVCSVAMETHWQETEALIERLDALRVNDATHSFALALGGKFIAERPDQLKDLPIQFTANDLRQFLQEIRARFPAE